jgi:hypothetical protein
MKRYTALLLTAVSMAGLAWASVLTIRMAMAPASVLSVPGPKSIPAKDGEDALQRLRGLNQVLGQIDRLQQLPEQFIAGPIALAPLAATSNPALQLAQQKQVKKEPSAVIERPVISLVYLSSDMQRAVINGNLYANGDLLPDGGRLADIGMSQVVIDVGGRRQVLQVPRNQVMGSIFKPAKVQ